MALGESSCVEEAAVSAPEGRAERVPEGRGGEEAEGARRAAGERGRAETALMTPPRPVVRDSSKCSGLQGIRGLY